MMKMDLSRIFKSWYNHLKEYINKDNNYYNKLFEFLTLSYNLKIIHPKKNDIFRSLQLTDFNELKVVILGRDPYPDDSNKTGEELFSPVITKIKDCIEQSVYEGLYLNFDPTFETWYKQGVLMLNTALTIESNKIGSHTKYWNKFITNLISAINKDKTGIIFCLWGKEAQEFKEFINEDFHYILEYKHPLDSKEQDWKCTHFNDINDIITKNNGKSENIRW
jgi:uracil-DNA glycosylase